MVCIFVSDSNASLNALEYASMPVAVERAAIICCRLNCSIAITFISRLVWTSRKITTATKAIVVAEIIPSSHRGEHFPFEKIFENKANPPLTVVFPQSGR
ncbi:hypothetical protein ES703_56631 [subsurface metagenome]